MFILLLLTVIIVIREKRDTHWFEKLRRLGVHGFTLLTNQFDVLV